MCLHRAASPRLKTTNEFINHLLSRSLMERVVSNDRSKRTDLLQTGYGSDKARPRI